MDDARKSPAAGSRSGQKIAAGVVRHGDLVEQFRNAMLDHGINPPDTIEFDTENFVRYNAKGKGGSKKPTFYKAYSDGVPTINFGDFSVSGKCHSWSVTSRETWTPEERRIHADRMRAVRAERKAEEAERLRQAITKCAGLIKAAKPATNAHPYLTNKGINPAPRNAFTLDIATVREIIGYPPRNGNGEPLTGDILILPLTRDGQTVSVEMIDGEGRKSALAAAPRKGGYWTPAQIPENVPVIAIGEGMATVTSVHHATGWPVVATFGNSNLEPVAQQFRASHPTATLVLLADLQKDTREPDPHARKAADTVKGILATPDLNSESGTDWNDYTATNGPEATAAALTAILEGGRPLTIPKHWITVDDLENADFSKTWLVEGIIESGRAYQFFGAWKSGKTLAVLDVCSHLANGQTWAGCQTVPTLIVWVASESLEDVRRRLAAWKLRHSITTRMPFFIREMPVHLDEPAQAERLRYELAELQAWYPDLPMLLVIDTVARSMSGKSSENAEGLQAFTNNAIDQIIRPLGCAAIFVHHSGHGDKERGRGYSGFPAALDGSVMVSMEKQPGGPGFINVAIKESRSTAGDDSFRFRLDIQEINGRDNFGNTLAEPVLHYTGDRAPISAPRGRKPAANYNDFALELLRTLHEEHRARQLTSKSEPGIPRVQSKTWQDRFIDESIQDERDSPDFDNENASREKLRARFNRAKTALVGAGKVHSEPGGFFHPS